MTYFLTGSEVDDDDMDENMADNTQVTEGFQRINPDSPEAGTPTQVITCSSIRLYYP